MSRLAFVATLAAVVASYFYIDSRLPASPSDKYRRDLLSKVADWPESWLTNEQRSDVTRMVRGVANVNVLMHRESENDYGGAIGSFGMRSLYLSPLLLFKSGFQHDRVLLVTLLHESVHWKQLVTEEFNILRHHQLRPDSLEFVVLAAKMEIPAYELDYHTTRRLNSLDARYLLPTCFEYVTRTQFIPISPDARRFGYGRALIALHKRINDIEHLGIQEKYDLYDDAVQRLHDISPEYDDLKNAGPIDCKNKHGGDVSSTNEKY